MFTTAQILEAKAPSIYAYMIRNGHTPATDKPAYALFKSPFREDKTASFKVDKIENLFYDFGSNQYGDFITFYKSATGCNFKEAVAQILQDSFSFQCQQDFEAKEQEAQKMEIHKVKDLQNMALVEYLYSRRIGLFTARAYCQEIYYYANGKHYFALGFENDSGGYELRNKYFKGCIGKKDITTIFEFGLQRLAIFEGFIDLLAAVELWEAKGKMFETDVIVLNSVTQLNKCLSYLDGYETIYTFLDNDPAGRIATEALKKSYKIHDCNALYADWKDISEFWEKEHDAH